MLSTSIALSSAAARTRRSGRNTWPSCRVSMRRMSATPHVGRRHGFHCAAWRDRGSGRRGPARHPHGAYMTANTGTWAAALAVVDGAPPRPAPPPRRGQPQRPSWCPGWGLAPILQALTAPGDEVVVFRPPITASPQDQAGRRAAHPRCAAGRDPGPLCHGSRRVAREADAAHEQIVFFSSPTTRAGPSGRSPRFSSGDSVRRRLQSPGVRRDPLPISSSAAPGIHPRIAAAPRSRAPPDHLRRRHQDLQSRRRSRRSLFHLECRPTSARLDARIMATGLGLDNSFGHDRDPRRPGARGEAWLDASALARSRQPRDLFDARIEAAAPGARSMRLEAPPTSRVGRFLQDGSGAGGRCRRGLRTGRAYSPARLAIEPGGDSSWLRFGCCSHPLAAPILEEALGGSRTRSGILELSR